MNWPADTIHANRTLDFTEIDAVGFDLDHTLAVYDDEAVNGLACDEARRYLVEVGHSSSLASAAFDGGCAPRGLAIALDGGHLVKLDGADRIVRAQHSERWLGPSELDALNARENARFHHLNSPFDIPTGFMFSRLVSLSRDPSVDYLKICTQVRQMLDRAHTRGTLKKTILSDPGRYVAPLPGLGAALDRFRDKGKRTFIVTNSEHAYTLGLLDYLLDRWRERIDVVCVSADKPRFFSSAVPALTIEEGAARVLSGGGATWLERVLGVGGERILFVGDNPVSDTESAHRYGWKTLQVLNEIGVPESKGWGSMLYEGKSPTRLARTVADCADLIVGRIEPALEIAPDQHFPRASG